MKSNAMTILIIGVLGTMMLLGGCSDYKLETVNPIKPLSLDAFEQMITAKTFNALVVVFAVWCRPCREELPDFAKLYNEHKYANVELMAVSIDDGNAKKVQFLVDDLRLPFPVYHVGSPVIKQYRILGIPTLLVVKGGMIVKQLSGQQTPKALASLLDQLSKEVQAEQRQ
jgi:thiol-disulfide isomerase/thioredoxin